MSPRKSLSPDTTHEPVFTNELTLEVTYSPHKRFRAIVTRDSNERFRVRLQRWSLSEVEITGDGFWVEDERGRTIAASLEIARALAEEKLTATDDLKAK